MPKPLRVLLLEDSEKDAEIMLREIRRAGYSVDARRVETKDAFAAALNPELDLILADYSLPDFDGSRALRMLQATGLDIPFILVTGTIGEEQAVAIMLQGAFAAVLKDRLGSLGSLAGRALEERALRRENRRIHETLSAEATFRKTIEDSMLPGMLAFDNAGKITHANASACQMIGYSREELLGMAPPFPFWPPAIVKEVEAAFFKTLKNGESIKEYETLGQKRDGSIFKVLIQASPILDPEGKSSGIVVLLNDITERKRAEDALRKSEENLRVTTDAAHLGLWAWDVPTGNVEWSALTRKLIGRDPQGPITYQDFLSAMHPDERDHIDSAVRDSVASKKMLSLEMRALWPDGSVHWLSSMGQAFYDPDGKPVRMAGILFSIDERKKMEAAIQDSLKKLERFQIALDEHSLVTIADAEGKIIYGNDKFCSVYQYSREELMGQNHRIVNSGLHSKEFFKQLWETITHGRVWKGEVRNRAKDGSFHWSASTIVPFVGADGKPYQYVAIRTDITERKQAEEEKEFRNAVLTTEQEASIDGILVVDEEGKIVSYNTRFLELWGIPAELAKTKEDRVLLNAVLDKIVDAELFLKRVDYLYAHREEKSREEISLKDGRVFDRYSAPMIGTAGRYYGRIWYFRDVTDAKRAEINLRRHVRALTTLSRCNEALVRATDENVLLRNICWSLVTDGGYRMVWVGYKNNDADKHILPVASFGDETGYLKEYAGRWEDGARANGPTGLAIRTGVRQTCADIQEDPNMAPWRESAIKRGYLSCAAFPLISEQGTFGALTIFAKEVNAFTDEEFALLEELAKDLAYGISALRTRAERDKAQAALKASEHQVRLLLDSTAESIYGIDLDGNCTFANLACAKTVGLQDASELLGQNMHSLLHHKRSTGAPCPSSNCAVLRAVSEGQPAHEAEEMISRIDGTSFPAEIWSYPVFRDGQPIGAVTTFMDISERKAAQKKVSELQSQMLQAEKMESIGRLAGGVAHDFNNMLMVILANCSFLLQDLPAGDPRRSDVEEIKKAGDRAAALTRQLLIFSRRHTAQLAAIDLNELIRDLDKMLRRLLGEDIEVITELCAEPAIIWADAGQLEQAITNLATNARDAMPDGGRLSFRTRLLSPVEIPKSLTGRAPRGCVRLEVQDNGSGMPPSVLEHVFEPFFTTKEPGKGTGLGLASAYGTIQSIEGEIRVQSELGKGTTFTIDTPLTDKNVSEVESPASHQSGQGHETILLVEDQEGVRRADARLLQTAGYTVLSASGEEEAMHLLRESKNSVDLLLTDVVMPGKSGGELAREARELVPGIKILFMSGYIEHAALEELHHAHFEVLNKPFAPQVLTLKVREALDAGKK